MANKLLKKIEITGILILETGLHIGGTNSSMSIGGIDKAVIRNPINNQPIIPGSSLKGKMRSLLEISTGNIGGQSGGVVKNGPSSLLGSDKPLSADLFGNADKITQKPSRLIVRDLSLINHEELLSKTEIPYTEGKTEVVIDRITSAANPRQMERVPAGAKFKMNLVLNVWEDERFSENELIGLVVQSLLLLKDDYLGGHGSRGYGQVSFEGIRLVEKSSAGYYAGSAGEGKDITEDYQSEINKLMSRSNQAA